jgi:Bacterial membrane protein YfhO
MPSNWGMNFTVGTVPVFKYLDSRDVDEVGYTLRTASLMTAPEYFFDERDPSDYQLFGIHYLIIPSGYLPPVPAHLVQRAGPYSLWSTGTAHSVHIGRTVGVFAANRTNLGLRSISLLHSQLAQRSEYLRAAFDHADDHPRPLHADPREASPGNLITETDNLNQGEVAITAKLHQPGIAVLSASFDPGWTATVDGHARPTQMIAPALVATAIPAGTHNIEFRYRGFRGYPLLFALCGLTLAATLGAQTIQERHAKRASAPIATGQTAQGTRNT